MLGLNPAEWCNNCPSLWKGPPRMASSCPLWWPTQRPTRSLRFHQGWPPRWSRRRHPVRTNHPEGTQLETEMRVIDIIAAFNDVGSYRGAPRHLRRGPQDREEGARPLIRAERPSVQLRHRDRHSGQARHRHLGPHIGQAPAARSLGRRPATLGCGRRTQTLPEALATSIALARSNRWSASSASRLTTLSSFVPIAWPA